MPDAWSTLVGPGGVPELLSQAAQLSLQARPRPIARDLADRPRPRPIARDLARSPATSASRDLRSVLACALLARGPRGRGVAEAGLASMSRLARFPPQEHMAVWCILVSFPFKLLLLLTGLHLSCLPLAVEATPFRFDTDAAVRRAAAAPTPGHQPHTRAKI